MKRYMRSSENIYGMSMELKKAKDRIENLGDRVLEHVCKCILYGDSTSDYKHWIEDEISTWISYVNDLTVKPKNNKLKASDYDKLLLGGFGDSFADARINLAVEYNKCRDAKEQYPEVTITQDMMNAMLDATLEMHNVIPTLLASKNTLDKKDIEVKVHNILDKYCI